MEPVLETLARPIDKRGGADGNNDAAELGELIGWGLVIVTVLIAISLIAGTCRSRRRNYYGNMPRRSRFEGCCGAP